MNKILSKKEFDKINEIESWLYNYKSILASIENLKQELEMSKAYSLTSVSLEGSGKTNKFSSMVENSVQKVELLESRIKFMENKINQINRALDSLNEIEYEIINKYYIENKNYFEFIGELHRSERTCKRIKDKAINKIIIAMFGM